MILVYLIHLPFYESLDINLKSSTCLKINLQKILNENLKTFPNKCRDNKIFIKKQFEKNLTVIFIKYSKFFFNFY